MASIARLCLYIITLVAVLYATYHIFFYCYDVNDPSGIYKSLRLEPRAKEIRLLRLLPGKWEDDIVCILEVKSLGALPPFEALSYAWKENFPRNSPSQKNWWVRFFERWGLEKLSRYIDIFLVDPRKRLITVNGRPKPIGVNLELALRHKRTENKKPELLIWADALCINQDDVNDRNRLVANMREVYRKARKVEVWLGAERDVRGIDDGELPDVKRRHSPSLRANPRGGQDVVWSMDHIHNSMCASEAKSPDQQRVLQCIADWEYYNNRPKSQRGHLTPDYTMEAFAMIYKFSLEAFADCDKANRKSLEKRIPFLQSTRAHGPMFEVLQEFMNRLWWNRLWVVQETVIATSVTVRYGRFVVPWELLCHAATLFSQHRHWTCCSPDFEKFPTEHDDLLKRFSDTVIRLNTWRSSWTDTVTSDNPHNRVSLLRLLREFRSRSTSDLHDKIYALLPLVNYWGLAEILRPQYELDVASVYEIVVHTLIDAEKSLNFLIGTAQKSQALSTLASWVPDWSQKPEDGELARLDRADLYHAGTQDKFLPPQILGRNTYMRLKGIKHDVVKDVSDQMPKETNAATYTEGQQVFRKWQVMAELDTKGHLQYVGRSNTDSR